MPMGTQGRQKQIPKGCGMVVHEEGKAQLSSTIAVDNSVNLCYKGTLWLAHPIPQRSAFPEASGGALASPEALCSRLLHPSHHS